METIHWLVDFLDLPIVIKFVLTFLIGLIYGVVNLLFVGGIAHAMTLNQTINPKSGVWGMISFLISFWVTVMMFAMLWLFKHPNFSTINWALATLGAGIAVVFGIMWFAHSCYLKVKNWEW